MQTIYINVERVVAVNGYSEEGRLEGVEVTLSNGDVVWAKKGCELYKMLEVSQFKTIKMVGNGDTWYLAKYREDI